ncbi:MAG: tetratricopeptide repeat protein [Flavobacteriales bacterium]|nr:tetratricopeptide repeat protein [Flavobacteriales bacterium]
MFWQEASPNQDPKTPKSVQRFERMKLDGRLTFFDALELEDIIQFYMGCNNPRKALEATRYAVQQYPYSTNFLLTKSQLLASTGRMRMALKVLEKVESIDPLTSELFIIKGAILSKLNHHNDARECFNQAILHSEHLDVTYLDIALECENLGNFKEAINFLKKSFDANPRNPQILRELAFCFDVTDQVEESIRFHSYLIDNQPYHETAWYNLGIAYSKLEKFENALDAFEYATLIRDDYADAHFEMGETLSALGRRNDAIKAYEKALDHQPSSRTLYCIGECWEDLEDYGKAARYYKRALRKEPDMSDAWFGLGIVRYHQLQYSEAIQHIRMAIRLDEYNSEYWHFMGEIMQMQGEFTEAEEAFRNVIRLEPFTASVWIDLATSLISQGRNEEAIQTAIEGSREHPDYAKLFYHICGYLMNNGQIKESYHYLEEALSLDYKGHSVFLESFPQLVADPHITHLIELYQPSR